MTSPRPSRRRRLPRVQVPAVLAVAYVGVACPVTDYVHDEGCGDNNPECEVFCRPVEYRDASIADVHLAPVTCPRCANADGDCPRGCEHIPDFS